MKVFLGLLVTTVIFWLMLGAGADSPRKADIPADLAAAVDLFYAAVAAGDAETRVAMFTEDALMMPNHWTAWRGRDAIAGVIRGGGDSVFRIRGRKLLDAAVSGDLAYTVNSYYYTYHAAGSKPQWHKTKNVHIWKRGGAGQWKLHVDIWNSDVPMSEFADESYPETD
ncbi:MAG: nuclear transport factor 2 family protein [Acidobacteria bacterium]|nr:nuclear transport factor 2 family protein [Acidobacteriota bacterium]